MGTAICEKNMENFTAIKKHSIDVHFSFPFFFKRYYMVFSLGTDHRKDEEGSLDSDNRVKTTVRDMAIAIAVGILYLIPFVVYFALPFLWAR